MTAETSNARGEWVLVPRVPTPEMEHEGIGVAEWTGDVKVIWSAMLAATPPPPADAEVRARELLAAECVDLPAVADVILHANYDTLPFLQQASLRAIIAALSQQPEPTAKARGVVDGWKPSSVEPPHNPKKDSLGTEYLIYPPTSGGDRTAFYGRRLGGAACWYRYGAQVHGVDYWQELPASPAALTGERNG